MKLCTGPEAHVDVHPLSVLEQDVLAGGPVVVATLGVEVSVRAVLTQTSTYPQEDPLVGALVLQATVDVPDGVPPGGDGLGSTLVVQVDRVEVGAGAIHDVSFIHIVDLLYINYENKYTSPRSGRQHSPQGWPPPEP